MPRTPISAALLLVLPLTLASAACADRNQDRSALRNDEMTRDLNLALPGDTAPATFQDTALAATPAPRAPEPQPEPPVAVAPRPLPREPVQDYVPPRARPRERPRPPVRERRGPARPTQDVEAPEPLPAPAPAREAAVGRMGTVAAGATMAITLNQTLGTDRNEVGDTFTGTLAQPVLGDDGQVLLPTGSTVHGRVTAVSRSNHVGEAAVISLAFESVTVGRHNYPLSATVVEAHPQRVTRNTVQRTAERAAVGAAAGAILGKIFGRSPVGGAVLGAAAGTAIAMGTADVDAVLPQGSQVTIRTDAPVSVAER